MEQGSYNANGSYQQYAQQDLNQYQEEGQAADNYIDNDQVDYNFIKQEKDYGYMPPFQSADYSDLQSIKEIFGPLKNINDKTFTLPQQDNTFFIKLASQNKDHLHKAYKYGVWTSNRRQNAEIQKIFQNNPNARFYIYFFFNNSLQGMAELKDGYDSNQSFQLWIEEHKWFGILKLDWIFVGKFDVPINIYPIQQGSIQLSQENGLKLLEYARESDFNTVFNDFDEYDEKELELRKRRQDNEYLQTFNQKHSEYFNNQNYKNYNHQKYYKNNRNLNHGQQNYQNYKNYDYRRNQQFLNQNINQNFNSDKYNMNNFHNYHLNLMQQPHHVQYMLPLLDQSQIQSFIGTQPLNPFFNNTFQSGYKKPYKKQFINNNQQNYNGNPYKGYNTYNDQNQDQQNNQEENYEQQPIENQDSNNLNGNQNHNQQQQNNLDNDEHPINNNNNRNENQGNPTPYQNFNNNSNYNNGFNNNYKQKQQQQQYNRNQYQTQNFGGYNGYNKYGKHNGNNNYNNRGNYKNNNYNNQNRQQKQNFYNQQSQGFEQNYNDFPQLGEQHQQDQINVEKQLNNLSLNDQQ